MHYHTIEDQHGDVVDLVPLCSDACNRDYCASNGLEYQGWYGCQEGGDTAEFCANCGVFAGGTPECDHQRDNVVVNQIVSELGDKCSHGHWIQLPIKFLRCM